MAPHSEVSASPLSRFVFSWLGPFLALGWKRPLEQLDLGDVLHSDASAPLGARLESLLLSHSLIVSLVRLGAVNMAHAGVGKLIGDLLGFVSPLAVAGIISFVAAHAAGAYDAAFGGLELGWWWLIAGVVSGVVQNLLLHRHHHHSIRAGMNARTALGVVIFRKSLALPASTRARLGAGRIQTLLAADAQAVNLLHWYLHYAWAAPLQLAITLVLLVAQLGYAPSLVALGVLILYTPLQGALAARIGTLTKLALGATEKRVAALSEALAGIRVVKALGWERAFIDRIAAARDIELQHKRAVALASAINSALVEAAPLAVSAFAFATFSGMASAAGAPPLTPIQAFVSLTLFGILRLPLMVLPSLASALAAARVSLRRIEAFLAEPDAVDFRIVRGGGGEGTRVIVDGASFSWGAGSGDTQVLTDISLDFAPGSLTMVVGTVASGKTTLLNALLGELTKVAGSVTLFQPAATGSPVTAELLLGVGDSSLDLDPPPTLSLPVTANVAYAAQSPIVVNATLRENILYYSAFDDARYQAVLEATALTVDVASLAHGDATEIGERGVTLSGGQKARVALARALYSTSPLLLLDDPLAAVDARVAQHLWTHALRGPLSQGRTIILVSHALQFLPRADAVVCLDAGRVAHAGAVADALLSGDGKNLVRDMLASRSFLESELAAAHSESVVSAALRPLSPSPASLPSPSASTALLSKASGGVIAAEDRVRGAVPASMYVDYAKAFHSSHLACIVFALVLFIAARVATDVWLAVWSADSVGVSVGVYVGTYCGISAASAVFTLVHAFAWALGGIVAARALHIQMLTRVLRSPVSFFDATPVGRIINRHSVDIATLDKDLPLSFATIASLGARVGSTLIVQAVILPWTLLASVPLLAIFSAFLAVYRASARELRRLDLGSKSLATSVLAETLAGAASIRNAQGAPTALTLAFAAAQDKNIAAHFRGHLVNRYLGVRLDWLGIIASFGVVALVCLVTAGQPGAPSAGLVGLALSYSAQIAGLLNWVVRSATECETYLASAERVASWSALPNEHTEGSIDVAADWPTVGAIELHDLTVRYRMDLPPALDAISLSIPGGKSVAVVGRTGSGKSTLGLSLLRILEAEHGGVKADSLLLHNPSGHAPSITIDGVDIAHVPLDILRSRIALVSQDAAVFSGTLRDALDPLHISSGGDAALSAALTRVGLDLPLDTRVEEGGGNLSQGERQLVCLARALLRRARVVILDESTAALDGAADAALTKALKDPSGLGAATVISIVHRVSHAMDADLVIVLEAGRVLEMGSPGELLRRSDGAFAALVTAAAAST